MIRKIELESPNIEDQERAMVEGEIGMARQMCSQMGNNDSEFDLLDNILSQYEKGHLTAEQAIREARAIPENKIQK